ncbi:hypothetical protein HanRHA438_Chr11g0480921 [Helianthus annuus]|nr:hypothetical protein HanRHA438_Chr11g0480921 [Helianthus annuus]
MKPLIKILNTKLPLHNVDVKLLIIHPVDEQQPKAFIVCNMGGDMIESLFG